MSVLFEGNGQSLKLGEVKLEKSQVCVVPVVKIQKFSKEQTFVELPWPSS